MTKEQKIEAYAMRLDGNSLQKIADHFGVSKQYIQQIIPISDGIRKKNSYNKCVYQNIAKWMQENDAGFADLAGGSDRRGMYASTINFLKKPDANPTKRTIDQILKVTGLTYEQAFSREDGT